MKMPANRVFGIFNEYQSVLTQSRHTKDLKHLRRAIWFLVVLSVGLVIINVRSLIPDSIVGLDINPGGVLHDSFGIWSPIDLGQRINGSTIAYLPVAFAFFVLHGIGIPMLQVQQLWFIALLSSASVGMLTLYRTWWDTDGVSGPLLAGVLYGFSPYVLLNLKGASVLLIPYAALPLLALLTTLMIRRNKVRYAFAAVLISTLLVPGINPPLNAIMLFVIALVAVCELGRNHWNRESLLLVVGTGSSALIMATWWIGPFVQAVRAGGASGYFVTDPLTLDAANSSFVEVLRLTGLWALYQGWAGVPYFPSQGYLLSKPIIALTLLAPLLALLAVWRFWDDLRTRFLLLIVVIAVPLAVSIYPPSHPSQLGSIYLWAYDHFFFLRAFRSTYKWVWPIAFAFALLVPTLSDRNFQIAYKHGRPNSTFRSIALVTVICIAGVYVLPFARSSIFPPNFRVGTIPTYWYEAAQWLDHQPGPGRVLFTPTQGFPDYTWGSPGGDIASSLMTRPEITDTTGLAVSPQTEELLSMVNQAPTDTAVAFEKDMSLLGVRFVVQCNDVNWRYYGSPSPRIMRKYLSSQPGLKKVASFGKLDIYELTRPAHSSVGAAATFDSIVSSQGMAGALSTWQPDTLAQFGQSEIKNPTISSFTSSSIWNGEVAGYGPQVVLNGNPNSAWVSNVAGGIGQWLQLNFKQRRELHSVTILVRRDGSDAVPSRLLVSAHGQRIFVNVGADGLARAQMNGITSSHLRVTIEAAGPGGPNVGISEVVIPGVPLNRITFPAFPKYRPAVYSMAPSSSDESGLAHVVASGPARRGVISGVIEADLVANPQELLGYFTTTGLKSVSNSSQWNGLSAYSALATLDRNSETGWVSNVPGSVGEWLQYDFPRNRWVGKISIRGRENGFDAEATRVSLSTDGKALGDRNLVWNSDGIASINVNANISSLRITVEAYQKGRRGRNVGYSEVEIPGVSIAPKAGFVPLRMPTLILNHRAIPIPHAQNSGLPPIQIASILAPVAAKTPKYSFSIPIDFHRGSQLLEASAGSALAISNLTLTVGNPLSAKIQWLAVRQKNLTSLVVHPRTKAGLLYLDVNADPFWQARDEHSQLHEVGIGNAYGEFWALPPVPGQVDFTFRSGLQPVRFLQFSSVIGGSSAIIGLFIWWERYGRKKTKARREEI